MGRRQLSVCVGEAVGVLLPEKENRGRRFLSKQIQLSEEKKKEEHRARIRRGGASSLGGVRGWGGGIQIRWVSIRRDTVVPFKKDALWE